jgi:hypothetical protein
VKIRWKLALNLLFLGSNLLVRIAGESLTSSAQESISERREQCSLGLQNITPDRELARQPKIVHQLELPKTPGQSRRILQNIQGIAIFGKV